MSLFKILQILAVSGVLAGYSAWVRHHPTASPVESAVGEIAQSGDTDGCKIRLLTLEETKSLWRKPSSVFLDVRSTPDFAYGHIQGAISLPWEEFAERLPDLRPRLASAKAIVVYCKSPECFKSLWTLLRLRKEGFRQVMIYLDGWYEWTDHGLPVERTSQR